MMRTIPILFIALAAWAQPPGPGLPRPWWDSQVSRELNLSEAQIRDIRETQKEFRPRMMGLRDNVNKAEGDLDAAFNEDPVDQAKANDAINRLANARAEVTKAVSQMDLKLRTILTAEQWQELKSKQRHSRPPGAGRRGSGRTPSPTNQDK